MNTEEILSAGEYYTAPVERTNSNLAALSRSVGEIDKNPAPHRGEAQFGPALTGCAQWEGRPRSRIGQTARSSAAAGAPAKGTHSALGISFRCDVLDFRPLLAVP